MLLVYYLNLHLSRGYGVSTVQLSLIIGIQPQVNIITIRKRLTFHEI
jgi:hypothetical protein